MPYFILIVPPSKPESVSLVYIPADSPESTTKHMKGNSSSTPQEHETVSAEQNVAMNNTTALTYSALPKTDYETTSYIPSNDDYSSEITYSTTTYSSQQTTKAEGIVEGDSITVVCRGYVGKPPANHVFEKYLNEKIVPMQGTVTSTSIPKIPENCSYYRTTNITFQVTADDNNAVIRCLVYSSISEPELYVETAPIEVYCKFILLQIY